METASRYARRVLDPRRPASGTTLHEDYGGFVVTATLESGALSVQVRLDASFQFSQWSRSMKAAAAFVRRVVVTPEGLELLPPQN